MTAIPPPAGSRPLPYRLAAPVQQRVHDRLSRLVGPGPAAHFRDACRVMDAPEEFEAATALVGHLLRELEDALRDVLVPRVGRGTDSLESLDPDLERLLAVEGVAADSSLALGLIGLLRDRGRRSSREGHASQIRSILSVLDISPGSEIAVAWLRIARREYGLTRFAHRRNLDAPRPLDPTFIELWEAMVRVFDVVLARFEARFHGIFEEVDELRGISRPTSADARRLATELPNSPVLRRFFFEGIVAPAWLPLLVAEGLFRDPPAPIVDSDRRSVTYPDWPASRFLARVAREPSVQQVVARALDALPATENIRVVADVLEALTTLPSTLAVASRERALAWLERQDHLLLLGPRELLPLGRHLAESGDTAGARRILQVLVELRRRSLPASTPGAPRIGFWDYQRLLSETLPCEGYFSDSVELFCFLLERLEECGDIEVSGRALAPHFLRHAIEETSQDDDEDAFGVLVSAVRDAAAAVVERKPSRLDFVIGRLRTGETAVVWKTRIELNLLRTSAQPALSYIEERLLDRELLAEADCHHEYRTLLRERFALLVPEAQERLLALLVQAPSVDRIQDERLKSGAPPLSKEEARELRELVARDLLSLISESLPSRYSTLFAALVRRHGPARHPEFLSYVTSSFRVWGARSPISSEELSAMSVADVRAFLESWVPSANPFDDPTREGLASALAAAVSARPDDYAPFLSELRMSEPTYVRGVILGYQTAVKAKRPIPWEPVLGFCLWAVQQQGPGAVSPPSWFGRDPDWTWVRGSVLDLLRDGLDRDQREIPAYCREAVWSLLTILARDTSSPTQEQDAKTQDFLSSGINCTRGRALGLAIEYGVWVRESLGSEARGSFEQMPEVRALLSELLDPVREPSPSVRAVFGAELGRLAFLDSAWLERSLAQIFPGDAAGRELRSAAWSAYLRYGFVNASMYRLLKPIFDDEVAVFLANPGREEAEGKKLASHLAWLYVWGAVPLESAGPWAAFLAQSPLNLVRIAIGSVGRSLLQSTDPLPEPARSRLEALWRARLEFFAAHGGLPTDELEAFCWWFASRKFDPVWAAERILEGAVIHGGLPANHSLLEALSALAPSIPEKAARIVHEIVRGEDDPMLLSYEAPALRAVIVTVRATTGALAEPTIQATLGMLAAKGCTALLDLTSPTQGASLGRAPHSA